MIIRQVFFPCGEMELEGELQLPEDSGTFPVVIVCHPHPQYGCDMYNNVVEIICEALSVNSIAAFRFNFRGVGRSGGKYDGGVGEQDDVKAALDFVSKTPNIDADRIGLAGYSFGGSVALSVAVNDKRPQLLAVVSLPPREKDWETLKRYSKPKCLIVGSSDMIVQFQRVQQYFRDGDYFHVINGADHFWQEHQIELGRYLKLFFSQNLSR